MNVSMGSLHMPRLANNGGTIADTRIWWVVSFLHLLGDRSSSRREERPLYDYGKRGGREMIDMGVSVVFVFFQSVLSR